MHRDRLILTLLLCAFFALGACETFEDKDDDEHFPDRAPAANNLLRHYYDSNTWPRKFTSIKIPEGTEFEDDELDIEMPMGGVEQITDVRVRLYVVPPKSNSTTGAELECRVKAPGGTVSAWQRVDFQNFGADGIDAVDANAEVRFANEFDFATSGETSGGKWHIQLRDPIKDEDGRCIFRNATLRLNNGLPTGATFSSEAQNADFSLNPYEQAMPVRKGVNYEADIAYIGFKEVMRVGFTFTGGFNVTSFSLDFTVRHNGNPNPAEQIRVCLITPSGGWWLPNEIPDAAGVFETPSTTDNTTWERFVFSQDRADPNVNDSFVFLGEPAGGTWTLCLWEVENDSNSIFFSEDRAVDGTTLTIDTEASLSLG